MARPHHLSAHDHARIAAAIHAAESATSGEIYCVVARGSGRYFFHAAFFLTLASLAASTVLALILEQGWISIRLPMFVLAQLASVAVSLLVLKWVPALRLWFVPRGVAYRSAHDHALRQFLAHNVHVTAERTGVLIFVSLAERYAEVVADAGISEKVPQAEWNDVVRTLTAHARDGRLADGFVQAVARVGSHLARHFPPKADDRNELQDRLVEI